MRHLLVAAVVLLSAVSIWAIHRVGLTKHLSVSLHVSQTRQTQIVFGIVSIAGVLLMAFGLWGWMFPAYGVSMPTRWLFGLVLLGFTILAAFPYVLETWRAPVHNIAAWGMAALIPFAMLSTIGWTNVVAVKGNIGTSAASGGKPIWRVATAASAATPAGGSRRTTVRAIRGSDSAIAANAEAATVSSTVGVSRAASSIKHVHCAAAAASRRARGGTGTAI